MVFAHKGSFLLADSSANFAWSHLSKELPKDATIKFYYWERYKKQLYNYFASAHGPQISLAAEPFNISFTWQVSRVIDWPGEFAYWNFPECSALQAWYTSSCTDKHQFLGKIMRSVPLQGNCSRVHNGEESNRREKTLNFAGLKPTHSWLCGAWLTTVLRPLPRNIARVQNSRT